MVFSFYRNGKKTIERNQILNYVIKCIAMKISILKNVTVAYAIPFRELIFQRNDSHTNRLIYVENTIRKKMK